MSKFFLLLVLATGAAQATPPDPLGSSTAELAAAGERWTAQVDDALRRRAEDLAARGGARNLLAAALVWPLPEADPGAGVLPEMAPEAKAWFAAAQAVRPSDPLVDSLEAVGCARMASDCDREAAVARLLEHDPGNAAVHLLAAQMASKRGDAVAARQHLHDAARARRYEAYDHKLLRLMIESAADLDIPAPEPRLAQHLATVFGSAQPITARDMVVTLAFGRAMALVAPGYAAVSTLCGVGEPVADQVHRPDCMDLLALMARTEETLVTPYIALSLLSRHTAGEPEGDAWREQLRQTYWLQTQANPLMPGMPAAAMPLADYAAVLLGQGEFEAMRALLRRNGQVPKAPADWLPAHPHQRALVTTGVPADR